ncbi:MAG: Nif3-like dinuclear metal center hexameric protein [Actinobacteria bacterium]|nr:Nif3-like dinuclear metal center hexameric protein [Actinomycetota bacterium]
MFVSELLSMLDELAPFSLAEPWDNCGLLVGDENADANKIILALELTEEVLTEAITGGFGVVLVHHPILFSPVRRIVGSEGQGRVIRASIQAGINVIACHTNLDAAPGGIADIVGAELGLTDMVPLQMAPAGWFRFVGFVPLDALESVTRAVFAAGGGVIGNYSGCAYSGEGQGWFTPEKSARPATGRVGNAERTPEARWETVVPRGRLGAVVRAYVAAHPYEEPAFDVYPTEDRLPRMGLGRVGDLESPLTVAHLALRAAEVFALSAPAIGGARDKMVRRVAVLPGSGRSLVEEAAKLADVFVTGDLTYHDSEKAMELGLGLISLPHGEVEWAALRRWAAKLRERLGRGGPSVSLATAWRPAWQSAGASNPAPGGRTAPALPEGAAGRSRVTMWIDGGCRGNPGPGGIGIVLKTAGGAVIEEVGRAIGACTNNVAEYTALLDGLELAARHGAREVDVFSDSELLVKQMSGEYRVKNEGLKDLHTQANAKVAIFSKVEIRYVPREQNKRADALVNEALDAAGDGPEGLF